MRCEIRRGLLVPALMVALAMLLSAVSPGAAEMMVNEVRGPVGTLATASNGDSSVAVWLSRPGEGPPTEVRARCLGPRGGSRGDEILVSESACAIAPDVAMAPDGSFVVAWVECRPESPGRRVVAQRFSRWGQPVADRLVVGRHDTRSLKVAVAVDGAFVVAFSLQPEDDDPTLLLARVDAGGRSIQVNPVDSVQRDHRHVSLAVAGVSLAGDGTAVILWQGQQHSASWVAVDAVDDEGFARRWNLAECVSGERPGECGNAALGRWGGELLAVWTRSQIASEFSVAAQRLAAAGEPLGAPWIVVEGRGDPRHRSHLDVGRTESGSPFLAWAERPDATSPASTVVGRPVGPDWTEGAQLVFAPGPDARAPRIAGQSELGAVVVWLTGEGADTDIAARLIRPLEPAASLASQTR